MSRVNVNVSIATTDYDHFRDFRTGVVNAEGIDHTWLTLGHHEIFNHNQKSTIFISRSYPSP